MSSFPLYDVLFVTVQSQTRSEFKTTEKNKLIKNIQTLDQDGKNKVYALIRYYELQNQNGQPNQQGHGQYLSVVNINNNNNTNVINNTNNTNNTNIVSEKLNPCSIPFNGSYINDELIFDLEKLPLDLQYILLEFTKIHTQHMQDNQKIEKMRKKKTIE